jgi:glycine cleavage system regulatory protein
VRTLVLTVLGDDRPGLVEAIASVIADAGGSWDRSHMSRLAGKFAGIVEATVPPDRHHHVVAELRGLSDEGLLRVEVESADGPDEPTGQVALHLLGSDRPGIVREISATMASLDVSIVELETETTSAPMAGELLFAARVVFQPPAELELERVRDALEELANELMVDIELSTG